jgi:hypothetical protein
MEYSYGEIFERLGVPGMGRRGATWCGLTSDGVLVLMAHQNYVRKTGDSYQYEHPPCDPATLRTGSAKRSLDMIGSYFAVDRKIILPVAVFITDGYQRADGTWEPSKFDHATGAYYEGRMKQFERDTCYLLCDLGRRASV